MRDLILRNLSNAIDPTVLCKLLTSYENLVTRLQKGDLDAALAESGKFVEHTLRAIEFIRNGVAPVEIKSAQQTVKDIEKDAKLPEGLRVLVPRIAHSMIYDVRSKRGAIHVKEVDPRGIDAALCAKAASWILAELLRLYHSDDEVVVTQALQTLMRPHIPFVEQFGEDYVVTCDVPCEFELLLLLARARPLGLDRKKLGLAAKPAASTVSKALKQLSDARHVHLARDGAYHITGPGEQHLGTLMMPREVVRKLPHTRRRSGPRYKA